MLRSGYMKYVPLWIESDQCSHSSAPPAPSPAHCLFLLCVVFVSHSVSLFGRKVTNIYILPLSLSPPTCCPSLLCCMFVNCVTVCVSFDGK